MFTVKHISVLDLHLDEENPRFKINDTLSQAEIREYMLLNEKVLRLATKMVEMDTLLPGERIIISQENGKNIVLEGNRRTCSYQMLLNRKLIPEKYKDKFPEASKKFLDELKNLPVDVVTDRSEAMAFLAARHIEGVTKWSSISKWNISYKCFEQGKSINEICDYLVLTANVVKTNICNYKILLRGIVKPKWTKQEKEKLEILTMKPDKLIRILRLSETTKAWKLHFNNSYELVSDMISESELDQIIETITKRAFIENTINTRSVFDDIKDIGELFIKSSKEMPDGKLNHDFNADEGKTESHTDFRGNEGSGGKSNSDFREDEVGSNSKNDLRNNNFDEKKNNPHKGTGNSKNLPYFFIGLRFGHLNPQDSDSHGVARICNELKLFSENRLVDTYPIATAFLIRAIIEHSLIYYSKKHNTQGTNKLIWESISNDNKASKLSSIIKQYMKNLSNYILDTSIQQYFTALFQDYDNCTNPLNWVIHRPDEYIMSPNELKNLPEKGLLAIINYLIK